MTSTHELEYVVYPSAGEFGLVVYASTSEAGAWRELAAAYGMGVPSLALGHAIRMAPWSVYAAMHARLAHHDTGAGLDNEDRVLACLLLACEAEDAREGEA